jgi:hypothetical protein
LQTKERKRFAGATKMPKKLTLTEASVGRQAGSTAAQLVKFAATMLEI